jgi:integrase
MENKKVAENPASLVKLQRENNERVRWLNEQRADEESSLRSAIRDKFPQREPELDLSLHTGMRWSEQYHLRWNNVDLERGLITILQAKSGRKEHIRINSEAAQALVKLRSIAPRSEFVCPLNNYDHHREWWLFVLRAAKIYDSRWHDLRHTFASRLVMNGVDIFTVNRLLRHASIQMTMRYAHLADKHLKDAVEKLVVPRGDTESDTAIAGSKTVHAYVH